MSSTIIEPTSSTICGVVVTHNGSKTIAKTLVALKKNVNKIVVIDNDSQDNTLSVVRDTLSEHDVVVVRCEKNNGIATALNIGMNIAIKNGFEWILTMDQDSVLYPNVVKEMRSVYNSLGETSRNVACFAAFPLINGNEEKKSNSRYNRKKTVITSGNLVRISDLVAIGGYEEKLFIDSVDFDFCLKLGEENKLILVCNNAFMIHELGDEEEINLFGRKILNHTHSQIRKFYISRNHIYIVKRHFRRNPWFCIKKTVFYILFFIKSLVLERNRACNLRMMTLGIKRGICNQYEEYISEVN